MFKSLVYGTLLVALKEHKEHKKQHRISSLPSTTDISLVTEVLNVRVMWNPNEQSLELRETRVCEGELCLSDEQTIWGL